MPAAHGLLVLDAGQPEGLHAEHAGEPVKFVAGEADMPGVSADDRVDNSGSAFAAVLSSQASAGSRGPRPDPAQPVITRSPGVPTADQA